MNKKQRIQAVLGRSKPDRTPVSFWHHFPPGFSAGPPAVDAHLKHFETYDLDFLKIMGDNGYPRPKAVIASIADLGSFQALAGDEGPFQNQLDLIEALRKRLGSDVFCCTTLFNSWTTLRGLAAPPSEQHGPPVIGAAAADPRDQATRAWLQEDQAALSEALEKITASLANFAANCVAAGADGIFLSCRDDWVEGVGGAPGTYDQLVRDQDLRILQAVEQAPFNVLHVCGKAIDFQRFARYPVAVMNWADRECGPSIADAGDRLGPAICGGLNNLGTMVTGTAEQCAQEVRDALRQAGDRPIIIAPGCTYDPDAVPAENLHAIRQAVET